MSVEQNLLTRAVNLASSRIDPELFFYRDVRSVQSHGQFYRLRRVFSQRQRTTCPLSRQNLVTEIWILQPKKTFRAEGFTRDRPVLSSDFQTFMPE